jgi:glucuronoarabinoxylan endo-1,4-beta-xylanase
MKTSYKAATIIALLGGLAVAAPAQVVIGNWETNSSGANNDDGWINWGTNGTGGSITNSSQPAGQYTFSTNLGVALGEYSLCVSNSGSGYKQTLAIKLDYTPGDMAAFLTNHLLSWTWTVPAGSAATNESGYSQILTLSINASGYGWNNQDWANATLSGTAYGLPPILYFWPNSPVQQQTVTLDYSSCLPTIAAYNTATNGYIELVFGLNGSGGTHDVFYFDDVTLSGGPLSTLIIDQFHPTNNPYAGANIYAASQITNIWGNWFGGAFSNLVWDSASDANNNPASGSMKITANFNGGNSQFAVCNGLCGNSPPLNGLQYTNFQCDVRFAPDSATVTNNGVAIFGHLQFGTAIGYNPVYYGSVEVPVSNANWVHVSLPIDAVDNTGLQSINNVLIYMYGSDYSPGLSGVSTLWVDNIKFVGSVAMPANCIVDWNDVHQRIDGFGASSAWESSWTTPQADLLFSTNSGIAYTNSVGAVTTNNGVGLSLLRTRIAPDGTTVETNIMQMARDRGAKIWSTPWSPPAADKDSGTVDGGNFLSASNQAYANQLANYVENMKSNYQVDVYAISVQNEPDYNTTNYESCVWTSQQIHDFIPYLHNALSNDGVASTKIMIAESGHWDFDLTTNTLNDLSTSNLVGILAAHPYDYTVAPVNSGDKALWETEICTAFDTFNGSIANGLYWASQIHSFLTYAQVNAWHYWLLFPYPTDNESLTDHYGNPAKRMYVLGNYSRFVRPGYYRIGVSNNAFTAISAYKDPGSSNFAIVAINYAPSPVTQTFNLTNFTAVAVTPWITSSNLSLAPQPAIAVNSTAFTYMLPALSGVTFVGRVGTNSPPTLASVSNQVINAGVTLSVTNLATDPDVPPQSLTFRLVSGPTNATFTTNATNAIFTWRPLVSQANSTNPVSVSVSDNGSPTLSATNNFTVTVNPLTNPVFGSMTFSWGQLSLMAGGPQGPDYTVLTSTNLLDWQVWLTTNSPVPPLTLVVTNFNDPLRFYRLQLGP